MTATIHTPDSFLHDVAAGNIDLDTDTFYMMLVPDSYTYNRATHAKRSDVTEITGTGYTAGGKAVACTVTKDTTNHKTTIAFAETVWSGSTTITMKQACIYKHRGGAATADELVCFADQSANVSSSGGTFTVPAITLEYTHF